MRMRGYAVEIWEEEIDRVSVEEARGGCPYSGAACVSLEGWSRRRYFHGYSLHVHSLGFRVPGCLLCDTVLPLSGYKVDTAHSETKDSSARPPYKNTCTHIVMSQGGPAGFSNLRANQSQLGAFDHTSHCS